MKRDIRAKWTSLMLAVLVPVWLLSVSGSAMAAQAKGGGGGGGGGHASGGGGGGHSSGGGGGGQASGGGGGGHASGGGGGPHSGNGGGGGSHANSSGSHGSGSRAAAGGSSGSAGSSTASAVPRGSSAATAAYGSNASRGNADPPPYARPRSGPLVGTAVPRSAAPGTVIITPGFGGFYPWGLGLGLGGYYGYYGGYYGAGYYDPWFDPWYDPWYSGYGYGGYGYGGYGSGYSSTPAQEGGLRLKVSPKDASVFADGYYVGTVNDFDGMFQKLKLDAGSHRIEIRAPGYETLAFDVRIEADQTTTYKGELQKIQ